MMAKLARRGPDSNGKWLEGKIGFGHQRLSIIDLSSHGNQPMVDELLKLTLVFNGTIYNYKSLHSQLIGKGYSFFHIQTPKSLSRLTITGVKIASTIWMECLLSVCGINLMKGYLLPVTEWASSLSTIIYPIKHLLLLPIHRLY